MGDPGERTFEELLSEVEASIERLQGNAPPLEQALELYERAYLALKEAETRLTAARMKIETLRRTDEPDES